jgi:NAD-dependent dihydropyrimidine dehydrogenase PreA subunit
LAIRNAGPGGKDGDDRRSAPFSGRGSPISSPSRASIEGAKDRAVGRYVQTDYKKCVGCHVCADVCLTGYIQMGLGE